MSTSKPATTLYINVHRDVRRSDHVITINKPVEGSLELDTKLSAIGSDGRFRCAFGETADHKSVIQMVILSGLQERLYAQKLRDVVTLLAELTGTEEQDVIIHIEKAIMTTLSELRTTLDHQPSKAGDDTVSDVIGDIVKP